MNFSGFCYSFYGRKPWVQVTRNDVLTEHFFQYSSKLGTKFHTSKYILENLTDELNASKIK